MKALHFLSLAGSTFAVALLVACGGDVVVDPAGTTTGTTSTGGATGTGGLGSTGGFGASTGTPTVTVGSSTTGGTGGAVTTCPTPHPEPCSSVSMCPCNDGTTQIGGCPNGFDCAQACCGHDGSR
jgi:hypothetical protein